MASPFHASGEWIEVRVLAATTPVPLGGEFTAELKDTWVMTKRPEDQVVRWTFSSPTGRRHEVAAEYQGEFAWRVRFAPDEIGPWRYRWTHTFTTQPYVSSEGRFDVLGVDAEKVRLQLEVLARDFEALRPSADIDAVTRLRVQFYRLQRAAMLLETPESFQAASGIELRELLNRVRSVLWGKPMPDLIPMVAHRRPGDAGAPKRRLHPLLRRGLRKSKAMSLRVLSLVNR